MFINSYDVDFKDNQETKYLKFISDDWLWYPLRKEETDWCELIGKTRTESRKFSKNNFANDKRAENDVHAVCGELLASRILKEPINQLTVLKDKNMPDVGVFDVKTTTYDRDWRIYINESTIKRDRPYILATTFLYPKYIAAIGWIYGDLVTNGPVKLSFRNKEKAYWCSWHRLKPIQEILK